ncbi:ferritin [Mediannikoviicoccus vaginalis]|uniref:ferritin n=1 Tax=Mediannikoviicoccus vaginalis TaxID=2899727 RepID=UPI001F456991|nr:ferritin [Mediannikoviicoccus vaginalis]
MNNKKLLDLLNKQYNFEIESAYIYKAMSLWAAKENWSGVANFFHQQALEEMFHASKLENYLLDIGYCVKLTKISEPKAEYSSLLEVFKDAFDHEKQVTANFVEIMKEAKEVPDYKTEIQAQWFLTEQVEEEATFDDLIATLERISDSPAGLFQFDAELAQRKFSPEA